MFNNSQRIESYILVEISIGRILGVLLRVAGK